MEIFLGSLSGMAKADDTIMSNSLRESVSGKCQHIQHQEFSHQVKHLSAPNIRTENQKHNRTLNREIS